MGTKCYLCDGS
uniref:Uncharacterized protein n=1 Tax=Arundo donax TaxID=35708 RepID=A0A0A9ANM5_ARUDO